MKRCETLLAAQELVSLPEKLHSDPRAAIRPKDAPRINNGDATIFIRRSYDRLIEGKGGGVIEKRDYTCTFSKKNNKIATLTTNGYQEEFRHNDDEWAIMQNSAGSKK